MITPPKKCTFDCVYCQLGKTKVHVSEPEMLKQPLASIDRTLSDMNDVLKRIDLSTVDIVTFSGSGEPTLNLEVGKIAERVKSKIGRLPMALLTNCSLLSRKDVRRNLSGFDLVVAKLDAGDDEAFRSINRPADIDLNVKAIIDSIAKLKREIKGRLALEVMLLQSENGRLTNVKGEHFKKLVDAIIEVDSDIVQLEIPYRPPSQRDIEPPSQGRLRKISRDLSEVLGEEKLWTYGIHDRRGGKVAWSRHKSVKEEVLNLLKRRPCRAADVSISLGLDPRTAEEVLRSLRKTCGLTAKIVNDEKFYFKSE